MKPIRQMWKMVDVLRETEESRYNDRVRVVVLEKIKNNGLGKLTDGELDKTVEFKKEVVRIKLDSDGVKLGCEKNLVRESYVDRYYEGNNSKRKYGGASDKIGSIGNEGIDWKKDEKILSESGWVRILLEQCINAGFIITNPEDKNLIMTTDRGLSFTHPLWDKTHWRTRWFYGMSVGLFSEYIKELTLIWKIILWILSFAVTTIIVNWTNAWNIIQSNIQEFLLK